MVKFALFIVVALLFEGCEKRDNKVVSISVAEDKNFLEKVVVNGVSYQDDNLTPDINNGKLFGDKNITKENPSHYFVFREDGSLDHMATRYMMLNPKFILEEQNYIDRDARIRQIMSFRELPKLRPPKKKVKKAPVEEDLSLPDGLLPPKIPRIPLHIDVPDFPGV